MKKNILLILCLLMVLPSAVSARWQKAGWQLLGGPINLTEDYLLDGKLTIDDNDAECFQVRQDGDLGDIITANCATPAIVINEDGADQDLRIEGDNQVSLFKVDAGLDSIGIGTSVFDATGRLVLTFLNGTAPSGGLANSFQLYSADVGGSAGPHFMDELGNVMSWANGGLRVAGTSTITISSTTAHVIENAQGTDLANFNTTSSTIEFGGNLTISGVDGEIITLNQGNDTQGLSVYGFDDESTNALDFWVDANGIARARGDLGFTLGSVAGNVSLITGGSGHIVLDAIGDVHIKDAVTISFFPDGSEPTWDHSCVFCVEDITEFDSAVYFDNVVTIVTSSTSALTIENAQGADTLVVNTTSGTVDHKLGHKVNLTTVATTPYNVLATDYHLSVDTVTVSATINLLPLSAVTHEQVFCIKDGYNNAGTKNITVDANGTDELDQGGAGVAFIMNANDESICVIGNNTTSNWEIF